MTLQINEQILGSVILLALIVARSLEFVVKKSIDRITKKPNGADAYRQRHNLVKAVHEVRDAVNEHDRNEMAHYRDQMELARKHDERAASFISEDADTKKTIAEAIVAIKERLSQKGEIEKLSARIAELERGG